MQAVIDAVKAGRINARVCAVISSNYEAGGITKANAAGIPAYVCALKDFDCAENRDKKIIEIALSAGADLIVLAGYLGICSPALVKAFPKKIINIHPALLPKYGGKGFFGLNVHRAVIEAGEKVSGATVHYADEGTDTGEIIACKQVPVLPSDTPETLQKRVLEQAEHKLLIEVLEKLCKDK